MTRKKYYQCDFPGCGEKLNDTERFFEAGWGAIKIEMHTGETYPKNIKYWKDYDYCEKHIAIMREILEEKGGIEDARI